MRQTLTKFALPLLCLCMCITVHSQQDEPLFKQARKAAANNQWEQVFLLKEEMNGHPLSPYLDYFYIRHHFYTIDDAIIQGFLDRHPNTPMADKLRKKWLKEFAKNNQWKDFLNVYQPIKNMTLQCHYLNALYHTGNHAKAYEAIKPLWLRTKSDPESCEPIFNKWLSASKNKEALIWERFELTLLEKKFDLANVLVKKMSSTNQKSAKQILKLYKSPHMVTKKSFLDKKPIAEVVSYGLARLARINPRSGIEHWERYRKKYTFTQKQEQRIFQSVGLAMAVKKDSESTIWFRKVLGADLAPVYKDWMIRSAIIHEDWQLVLDSIDALTKEERKSLRWQYWYGRALQKLGKYEQALTTLNRVAKERNYYGFLASYYLDKPIAVKHEVLNVTQGEIDNVKNMPGYQRAKLLYELNYKHDARVELFTLMRHISEKDQYIITKLITLWGWYPQALRLSHYADHKDDILVRFPLPYKNEVDKNSNKYGVDAALIYAIMRQESYFMPQAKSPAGAIGLMQLMPSTAKKTSKQFSLSYNGKDDLVNGVKNITLGSAHLKKLFEQMNAHPALVIAAYNAGRNAVNRWLPKTAIPTDVWVETVPYYETRKYLRSVIANYIVYQHRLGTKPDLSSIMTNVK